MLKERYISALLVLGYYVLSYLWRVASMYFFCVACIMFTEFTNFLLFLWENIILGMSTVSFNQYLLDLKVHWITWYHTKGGKLLKCNVNSRGGYLKGTNFCQFNQQIFFSQHLRINVYESIQISWFARLHVF